MFQTSSKCYVLLWSRPIVLATALPNKEGSWVLGLRGVYQTLLCTLVMRNIHPVLQGGSGSETRKRGNYNRGIVVCTSTVGHAMCEP